jgi:hypothetical protein
MPKYIPGGSNHRFYIRQQLNWIDLSPPLSADPCRLSLANAFQLAIVVGRLFVFPISDIAALPNKKGGRTSSIRSCDPDSITYLFEYPLFMKLLMVLYICDSESERMPYLLPFIFFVTFFYLFVTVYKPISPHL